MLTLTAYAGEWQVGLALGIVVIAVAAVIVIVIVLLALRIAQAGEDGRAGGRGRAPADGRARRHRADQRLGRADPARRPVPAEGGGREMTLTLAAISAHTYWAIALSIGFGAAVVVAILLTVLVATVGSIERSVDGLLEIAGKVAANTANIPQLEATAPVLALIVDEAVVQDGYMNALTDGFGDAA